VTASAPPTTAPDAVDDGRRGRAVARLMRLREGVRGLGRSRDMGQRLERGLLIAGSVLLPLGVILILMGWYGAAHTPWLFEQVPYALSGGILGLGLIFVGGFLYFGYWLTRVVKENRRQTDLLVDALARLEGLMGVGGDGQGSPAGNGMLVATATGSMLHRPDCPVVAGREGLRRVRADAKGFEPCKICEPLAAAAG
jgi:hypothetical protein